MKSRYINWLFAALHFIWAFLRAIKFLDIRPTGKVIAQTGDEYQCFIDL